MAKSVSEPKSAALQKTVQAVPRKRWTVMVFMGAGSIDGDAPLRQHAAADLLEMQNGRS